MCIYIYTPVYVSRDWYPYWHTHTTHIHTHTHYVCVYLRTCARFHGLIPLLTHTHTYIHTHTLCVCISTHLCTCPETDTLTNGFAYCFLEPLPCIGKCIHARTYTHTYTHSERERERDTYMFIRIYYVYTCTYIQRECIFINGFASCVLGPLNCTGKHTRTHTHTSTHAHTRTRTNKHTRTHTHKHDHIYEYIHVHVFTYIDREWNVSKALLKDNVVYWKTNRKIINDLHLLAYYFFPTSSLLLYYVFTTSLLLLYYYFTTSLLLLYYFSA